MTPGLWIGVGFLAQAMFSARFLVQWLVSERRRASVVPLAFWYLSIAGGLLLFTYAAWRRDPVIMVGQASGLLVYARNLLLIRHGRTAGAAVPASSVGGRI